MERPFKKPGSRIREQRELGADIVVNHVEWQPNLCQSDSPQKKHRGESVSLVRTTRAWDGFTLLNVTKSTLPSTKGSEIRVVRLHRDRNGLEV